MTNLYSLVDIITAMVK